MKALLETIHSEASQESFKIMRQELTSLEPYWHYHPELEISYIEQGRGMRFAGDNLSSYSDGDLALFGANLPHDRVSDKMDRRHTIEYVIQFREEFFHNVPECKEILSFLELAKNGLLFTNPSKKIISMIKKFEQEEYSMKSLIYLLDIIFELSQSDYEELSSLSFQNNFINAQEQSRVNEITSFILDNQHRKIQLDEVANLSGLRPHSFCRWFKQSVGHSFVNYLNMARIESACRLLLQTDQSISEIAYTCGFESIGHFNRVFKKFKKMQPSSYRRQE